jgi:hypothetical protein
MPVARNEWVRVGVNEWVGYPGSALYPWLPRPPSLAQKSLPSERTHTSYRSFPNPVSRFSGYMNTPPSSKFRCTSATRDPVYREDVFFIPGLLPLPDQIHKTLRGVSGPFSVI